MKRVALFTLLCFVLSMTAFAQMGGGKASPAASASCQFANGKTIKTDYSSPRMRNRKIYGGLVPYGEVWRTGANEATTFVTDTNLSIGGKDVPAGAYTIFTVPGKDKWTLIVNKKTGEWGIPYKYEGDELVRIDMQVSKLPSPVENFTIAYDGGGNKCTLRLDWETTRASVAIMEK